VNDDEQRETGQASFPLVHLATVGIGQTRGNVDQTGNHGPGGVDCQAIEDKSVQNSPPEQGTSSLELVGVLGEVTGGEGNYQDVGGGDSDEDHGSKDGQVGVIEGSIPDENPGKVQQEID